MMMMTAMVTNIFMTFFFLLSTDKCFSSGKRIYFKVN